MAYMMTQYYFHYNEKFNQWFAHLYEIKNPQDTSPDALFWIVNNIPHLQENLCLMIKSAVNEKSSCVPKYKYVSQKHQIDADGNLFLSCRAAPAANNHYATQFDFDKYCFENPNPDPGAPFDWNAAVYKAFVSPSRAAAKVVTKGKFYLADSCDSDSGGDGPSSPSRYCRNIETRIAENGVAYTRAEFVDYYGGYEEWDNALVAATNAAARHLNATHTPAASAPATTIPPPNSVVQDEKPT